MPMMPNYQRLETSFVHQHSSKSWVFLGLGQVVADVLLLAARLTSSCTYISEFENEVWRR